MENNTEKLLQFLTKEGIEVRIDNNPSEEKIREIKEKISRSEKIRTAMVKANEGGAFNKDVMKQLWPE